MRVRGCSCCHVHVGRGDVWARVGAVVSGDGLEEVKGHGWVVDDEAGPRARQKVEKISGLRLRSSPSRRVFINDKLPYPTRQEITAHYVKICK